MVTLAILGVLSAEILNTLTESLVDLIEPEYNLVAKMIKDVAAAGVLLTAAFSVIIGLIAFYPALGNFPGVLHDFARYRWPYPVSYTHLTTALWLATWLKPLPGQ